MLHMFSNFIGIDMLDQKADGVFTSGVALICIAGSSALLLVGAAPCAIAITGSGGLMHSDDKVNLRPQDWTLR